MPSLEQELTDPRLRDEEIARLTAERDSARKERRFLDEQAFSSALQLFTDARDGITRCYCCGRVKRRLPRRSAERH